jgi:uncharacterized membrane protein
MESKARLFGHPVHQMLVVFPLGLLGASVIFDLIYLYGGAYAPTAAQVSFALIAVGVIGALIAAPFGTIDWLAIPAGTRARKIGALHGGGNLVVVALFIASWVLRREQVEAPQMAAWLLSFAGAGLSLITAWLGGELVDRLGVGVSPHANLNARSSLEGPAEPIEAAGPLHPARPSGVRPQRSA